MDEGVRINVWSKVNPTLPQVRYVQSQHKHITRSSDSPSETSRQKTALSKVIHKVTLFSSL